jgi:hypothetical protein
MPTPSGAVGSRPSARAKQPETASATTTKVIALLGLAAVQVFAGVVLKLAQSGGHYAFSPQSSLVISETIKLLLSVGYLRRDSGSVSAVRTALRHETSSKLVVNMAGLAAVYAWNNSLAFWLFARADPGSIMLVKATSTIVSAVLLYIVRRFVLSAQRWLILAVQVFGLITAQYDSCKGAAVYSALIYGAMFLTLLNSNVANVWNESVIQNFEAASLATKNIYLYGFGALLNLLVFAFYRATAASTPSFFEGYGLAAMAVVSSNALIGITMNIVYRYADALVKTIATSITSIILLVLSSFFFGGRANIMVYIGGAVLVSGTYLYFAVGLMESRIEELSKDGASANRKAVAKIELSSSKGNESGSEEDENAPRGAERPLLLRAG